MSLIDRLLAGLRGAGNPGSATSSILGACNPELARKALEIEPEIGLLLPCNVVVRQSQGAVLVHARDPEVMVSIPGQPGVQDIADDAGARIDRAMATLSAY